MQIYHYLKPVYGPLAALVFCITCNKAIAQNLELQREKTGAELASIRSEINLSEARRAELAAEIDRLEKDRASINRNLIDTSARQRSIEVRVERAGVRLEELRGQQDNVKASLSTRRALLSEVLAALQRMGRKPPPAILVTPGDALSAVRSAILLGAVVPEIRAETEVLIAELTELQRIGIDIESQRSSLSSDLRELAEEEERLALLLTEKKALTNNARQELARQGAKAADLAAKAGNLGKLIETLEREITAVREAAIAARAAEAKRLADAEKRLAGVPGKDLGPDFSDTSRIAPAVEFEKAKGLLPMPAGGVEIRSFGSKNALGEKSSGISIATRINARIVSPADGWVVYAGPFRSYGQLLILNAGSGYHVILAGMEEIDVQLGQFVLAGEPVAVMGARRVASAEAVGMETSRPVLYVEFRKDTTSIDPSPWWADSSSKRVTDDS